MLEIIRTHEMYEKKNILSLACLEVNTVQCEITNKESLLHCTELIVLLRLSSVAFDVISSQQAFQSLMLMK